MSSAKTGVLLKVQDLAAMLTPGNLSFTKIHTVLWGVEGLESES